MADTKYTCPPQLPSGAGTFSDNLVGFQLVQGGGLTQGNFVFTDSVTEKVNRNFIIGVFSEPISLDTLQVDTLEESRKIIAKNFNVFPNFDLADVTNFTIYGSLSKRLEVSVQRIINYFPAAIEVSALRENFTSGATATMISFNDVGNSTYFEVDSTIIKNPFEIDFSVNAARNLQTREIPVSGLRSLTSEYTKYALFVNDVEYDVISFTSTTSNTSGQLRFYVRGNPFSGVSTSYDYLVIRPQNYYTEETFSQEFDEVEKFLLNRLVNPIYTASFETPETTDDGTFYTAYRQATWPLDGVWNLDIRTLSFESYLQTLSQIADSIDEYKTNLVSRFLTTDSLKEFDTPDQKAEKIFQIYGRSFDEVKHFIDALGYMNSVNYNIHNDIPSQLLKNLSETLGWETNVSPISNEDFLNSVFGNTTEVIYPGFSRAQTPDEVNYQFYRNLIMNSAHLFKSKGTRKSIEGLLRLIGAPDALVEFNENIYLADQRINMQEFNQTYVSLTAGTYTEFIPVLEPGNTFTIAGRQFTGYTQRQVTELVNVTRSDYNVDENGYPKMQYTDDNYFFQVGAGWYESTPQHRSPEQINYTTSVFTGENIDVQTSLEPFTYGQKYLDKFRNFPYFNMGFKLTRTPDNNKSWTENQELLRRTTDGDFNAFYNAPDEKLILNVKNIELFLNPAQGLAYDVWVMSNRYDYPIPESGLTAPYPGNTGVDWTYINPEPKKMTFFEFVQTFWHNMINVRDRMFSSDGKTSGYPLLQKMYWLYLESNQQIGVPNDNFNYTNMIEYVVGLGEYWMKLVEQMIPATTIWTGGIKYENSVFHRQKFVWRRQAGCRIIAIPCDPCTIFQNFYPLSCEVEQVQCQLFPRDPTGTPINFHSVLYDILIQGGVDFNNCDLTSLTTQWFITIKIENRVLVRHRFHQGFGMNGYTSAPSLAIWVTAVPDALTKLFPLGFGYDITNTDLTVYNLDCQPKHLNETFQIVLEVDYNILCRS